MAKDTEAGDGSAQVKKYRPLQSNSGRSIWV